MTSLQADNLPIAAAVAMDRLKRTVPKLESPPKGAQIRVPTTKNAATWSHWFRTCLRTSPNSHPTTDPMSAAGMAAWMKKISAYSGACRDNRVLKAT